MTMDSPNRKTSMHDHADGQGPSTKPYKIRCSEFFVSMKTGDSVPVHDPVNYAVRSYHRTWIICLYSLALLGISIGGASMLFNNKGTPLYMVGIASLTAGLCFAASGIPLLILRLRHRT